MIGTLINAILILASLLASILAKSEFPIKTQYFFRNLLAGFSFFIGVKLLVKAFDPGFFPGVKLILIALLSLILGNLLGKYLKLQEFSNKLGTFSRKQLEQELKKLKSGTDENQEPHPSNDDGKLSESAAKEDDKLLKNQKEESNSRFTPENRRTSKITFAVAILFCLNPVGIIGAIYEGLRFSPYILIIKAVMDLFFSLSLARYFKFNILVAIAPMVLWQGLITMAFQRIVNLGIISNNLILYGYDALVGFFCFIFILPILEIRKIELANYIPSILFIPPLVKLIL